MSIRLIERRPMWWPTLWGWLVAVLLVTGAFALWVFRSETFFSVTDRRPADILVVEGWIGMKGISAAKVEFDRGKYHYIVTSGTFTNNRWGSLRWNYATLARDHLLRLGVPAEQIISAPAPEMKNRRTYLTAVEVRRVLEGRGLAGKPINVFTMGVHARRSQLVFRKVFGSEANVGVVAWSPPDLGGRAWWRSSERAEDLLKETLAYPLELIAHSGRGFADER